MAINTLNLLLSGDQEIIGYYEKAKQLWIKIRESYIFNSEDTLANELTNSQLSFEINCGGRFLGQEIMAIVGIAQFYTQEDGFDKNINDVMKVKNAFELSHCSIEVKYYAVRASILYGLIEY
jgi:hypothetical protein